MSRIGLGEIVIIALILILFFGGKKIPEFFKGLGQSITEFKKASKTEDGESEDKDK